MLILVYSVYSYCTVPYIVVVYSSLKKYFHFHSRFVNMKLCKSPNLFSLDNFYIHVHNVTNYCKRELCL